MRYKRLLLGIILFFLLILTVLWFGKYQFYMMVSDEVSLLYKNIGYLKHSIIEEQDLEHLPQPVRAYLEYTGVTGKERIEAVRLMQRVKISTAPGEPLQPLNAEQYYNIKQPGFIWKGEIRIFPFISILVRDKLLNGEGNMYIKIFSLFPVADIKGPEMDQGTLARFFNEMMWFPTAYLKENIQWESIDSVSARGTIYMNGLSVSALLSFDDQGRLINFTSNRFYSHPDGTYSLEKWSTPIEGYKEFNGYMLPHKGSAIWHLESGDYEYIQLEIEKIEFNKPELY